MVSAGMPRLKHLVNKTGSEALLFPNMAPISQIRKKLIKFASRPMTASA
jgi:hypothetical protein